MVTVITLHCFQAPFKAFEIFLLGENCRVFKGFLLGRASDYLGYLANQLFDLSFPNEKGKVKMQNSMR